MTRLLTAAVGVPLALLATFRLPGWGFFLLCLLLLELAALEFAALGRLQAPGAPWWLLPAGLPFLATALAFSLAPELAPERPTPLAFASSPFVLIFAGFALAALTSLVTRGTCEQAARAAGAMAFALPYFALPAASLYRIQVEDPWILFLLLAIVWLGDTAAYYVGTRWGRTPMSPRISPKKTWEGALAGFGTSVAAAALWSAWRLEAVEWKWLGIAAVTAAASQLGDLVESVFKRAVGVKDSGSLVPGHGGVLDRMDAMLLAAPTLLLLLWAAGLLESPPA